MFARPSEQECNWTPGIPDVVPGRHSLSNRLGQGLVVGSTGAGRGAEPENGKGSQWCGHASPGECVRARLLGPLLVDCRLIVATGARVFSPI